MPTYTVRDPRTNRTVVLQGDRPPTEQELTTIFATLGAREAPRAAQAAARAALGEMGSPVPSHRPAPARSSLGQILTGALASAQGPPAMVAAEAEGLRELVGDVSGGVRAGLASTAWLGGDVIRRALGLPRMLDTPAVQAAMTPPASLGGQIGWWAEKAVEQLVPGARVARALGQRALLTRAGAEAATAAGVAGLQTGGDPTSMAVAGGAGAALPLAGAGLGRATAVARARHEPVPLLIQALKPRASATRFAREAARALPELKATEAQLGRPIASLTDLHEAIPLAKQRVQAQIDALMGPGRAMGLEVDLSPVADAVVRSLPRKFRLEHPEAAARLAQAAQVYRQRFRLQDAEELLRNANAELESFYAKYPVSQRRALAAHPEVAQLTAQAAALRRAIAGAIERVRPGAGPAERELKRRYGALLELEQATERRLNVVARQSPPGLGTPLATVAGVGQAVAGAGQVLSGSPMSGIGHLASGTLWWRSGHRQAQQTDALIRRALAAVQAADPVPIPPMRPVAGLLPRGPLVTPPPADPSAVRAVPATPARRLPAGLLPRGPLVTPPPADPSAVRAVEAARTVQRDPRTGRFTRVYTGEPAR